ncbi:D-TA family PLP-dependent enzyme [Rhodohalobacter sp. 614A]|uniref:D-TA family PLP-dependent enzyme n=1 Tax=Rhodohalobacter sp. 614A TaxID=2908649 RepID=UPI001F2BB540|nr:D-TA family PLP-dependent enzyme [Rhodohalobacter sp. 614A]
MMNYWFEIKNENQILSPALLFYPDRIRKNIQKMIGVAGSPDRLRPHIKTYKCREIVEMQREVGIHKFKCSTLAEAQMMGECGAPDVLLAYPLIGPNQKRFIQLTEQYPETTFSTLIDHPDQVKQWKTHLKQPLNIFIDLDVGMHRTGVKISNLKNLLESVNNERFHLLGFHAYDGHIRSKDLKERKEDVKKSFRKAEEFLNGFDGPKTFITGGSITFPIHAGYSERQLSPGTTLLWDRGYGESFPDLDFDIAAVLFTRIVSKPDDNLLCIDLGYKAVASEMKNHPPVFFPQIPGSKIAGHSEEHLTLKTGQTDQWNVGDILYGFPWHICPTVALHEKAGIVQDGSVTDFWEIESRNRLYFSD